MEAEGVERRLTTILSADVVGYSRLMGADETGTLSELKAHRKELIEPKEAQYHGRTIKLMGDGALMEFPSVVEAVTFAVEVQLAMRERNRDVPEDRQIRYRVGINIGDIIVEDEDIFGDGVNVAARLEGLSEPGGVCVSRNVFNQVKNKLDLTFEHLGENEVKNIAEPVSVYRIRLDDKATALVTPVAMPAAPARQSRWPAIFAGLVLSLVGIAGLIWWQPWVRDVEPASVERMAFPLPDKPSVAVLPFENLSEDPDRQRLSDGISENIVAVLAKVPELFVLASASTARYQGTETPSEIAEDFGVRYILRGSLQTAGQTIRVTAQLIDAVNGATLWTDSYDRTLEDYFAVQDEIALKIAKSLQLELVLGKNSVLLKSYGRNIRVWELNARAWSHFKKTTRDDNAQARSLSQQAIELEPNAAHAFAILGWTHVRDAQLRWSEDPEKSKRLAREFAEEAFARDEQNVMAHLLLGRIYGLDGEYDAALAAQQRAVEIAPNDAIAWAAVALTTLYAGSPKEAVALSKKAERLYPTMPASWLQPRVNAYYQTGQHDKSIAVSRRILARQPEHLRARLFLIASMMAMGRLDDARLEVAIVLEQKPEFSARRWAENYVVLFKDKSFKEPMIMRLADAGLPE